jgi:hypothetical protein
VSPLPRHMFWRRSVLMILSQKRLACYCELKQDVPDGLLLMLRHVNVTYSLEGDLLSRT